MKYIQNSGYVKDSANSIDCMDYFSRAADLHTNTYTVDTWGGREESDKKLPDPKCKFLQSKTHCHEFGLNSISLKDIKKNNKKEKNQKHSIFKFILFSSYSRRKKKGG